MASVGRARVCFITGQPSWRWSAARYPERSRWTMAFFCGGRLGHSRPQQDWTFVVGTLPFPQIVQAYTCSAQKADRLFVSISWKRRSRAVQVWSSWSTFRMPRQHHCSRRGGRSSKVAIGPRSGWGICLRTALTGGAAILQSCIYWRSNAMYMYKATYEG